MQSNVIRKKKTPIIYNCLTYNHIEIVHPTCFFYPSRVEGLHGEWNDNGDSNAVAGDPAHAGTLAYVGRSPASCVWPWVSVHCNAGRRTLRVWFKTPIKYMHKSIRCLLLVVIRMISTSLSIATLVWWILVKIYKLCFYETVGGNDANSVLFGAIRSRIHSLCT